jgi:hypothetical protein
VRTYIRTFEIEVPIELDVTRMEDGGLQIGSTPPLYNVNTSVRPSFHNIRFTATIEQENDAG